MTEIQTVSLPKPQSIYQEHEVCENIDGKMDGPFIFQPSMLLPDEYLYENIHYRKSFYKIQQEKSIFNNDVHFSSFSQRYDRTIHSFHHSHSFSNLHPSFPQSSFHLFPYYHFKTNMFQASHHLQFPLNNQPLYIPQQPYTHTNKQLTYQTPSCKPNSHPSFSTSTSSDILKNSQKTIAFLDKSLQQYKNLNPSFQKNIPPLTQQQIIKHDVVSFLDPSLPPQQFLHPLGNLQSNNSKTINNHIKKGFKNSKKHAIKKRSYKKRKVMWETWIGMEDKDFKDSGDVSKESLKKQECVTDTLRDLKSLTQFPSVSCEKVVVEADDVRKYLKSNSTFRPFKCMTCERMFSRSDHLITHTRTHTGEKPFKCDICGRKFARSDERKRHQNIHSRPRMKKSRDKKRKWQDSGSSEIGG